MPFSHNYVLKLIIYNSIMIYNNVNYWKGDLQMYYNYLDKVDPEISQAIKMKHQDNKIK